MLPLRTPLSGCCPSELRPEGIRDARDRACDRIFSLLEVFYPQSCLVGMLRLSHLAPMVIAASQSGAPVVEETALLALLVCEEGREAGMTLITIERVLFLKSVDVFRAITAMIALRIGRDDVWESLAERPALALGVITVLPQRLDEITQKRSRK